jgi:hypothetical protein
MPLRCPPNKNYKQDFLAIKYDYDTYCSTITPQVLEGLINTLDTRVQAYQATSSLPSSTPAQITAARDAETAARTALTSAFQPIGEYYANLNSIKERLNKFLDCSIQQVTESTAGTINEERYNQRANPQEAVMPRELVFGLFSELRPSSIPFILSAGVFMSCLSLLMIFQMFGFTGEIHMPPALSSIGTGTGATPSLAQNPMVLSGVSIVVVVALGILYFRSKK